MADSLLEGGTSQPPSAGSGSQGSPSGSENLSQGSSQQTSGSSSSSDWKTNIPEPLRGEKTWEKYKDIGSALQSLHHLEKKIGSSVNIPNEKSSPEEQAAFYEKLGVPKEPKDYGIKEPKLPDGLVWDKDGMSKFADVAHKLRLTPNQVQGVLDYYGNELGSKFQSTTEVRNATEAELKKEWGSKFDERLGEVHSALKSYDGKGDFKALLKEVGIDNDPRTLKFLQGIGQETVEHSQVRGERQNSMTKEDAERKVNEIQKAGHDHALYNKKDPKHDDAVREYKELLILANS